MHRALICFYKFLLWKAFFRKMGKGGGKCASREQIASSSRTPRLPATRSEKSVRASTSVAKPSSSNPKATESDPATLVPLIAKVICFRLFTA